MASPFLDYVDNTPVQDVLKNKFPSIPMSSPDLTPAEITAVNQVLQTPFLSIGPQISAFEETFASYLGVKHAIGVNAGTSGLHLCTIAAGIKEGDLVLTTPFSFIASANCILYERAIPVFVDVDLDTGNINPALVAEATKDIMRGGQAANRWLPPTLQNNSNQVKGRLKAILPVHAFGQPANMDLILDIAGLYNLVVIEDACESLGAEYKEQKAGTLGKAAVFAFYPNKQITTGEGGMIVTNNKKWANLFRSLRNQGRDIFNAWLDHTRLGYNYRLDEMSAALGLVQIQRVDELLKKRVQVADWYNKRLANETLIELPCIASDTSCMSWFVYVIRVKAPANRDKVMHRLAKVGVPSRPYFSPIHLQSFYRKKFGYHHGSFPVTEFLGNVSLALPFSGVMTEQQVDYVCQQLRATILSKL